MLASRWILAALACTGALSASEEGYEDASRAGWGTFVTPVPLELQAQRDLQPGQGVLVRWVRPGGTADSLGIKVGDVITTINDQPIASWRDIRAIVRGNEAGAPATAQVISGGGRIVDRSGEFKARLPRPANWPRPDWWANGQPMWGDFSSAIARQYAELLDEQQQLQDLRAEIEEFAKTIPQDAERPWVMVAEVHVGAAETGTK